MKFIKLSKGYITVVDDEDYEFLMKWKWCVALDKTKKYPYAVRNQKINGKIYRISMNRFLLGVENNKLKVDHADHCTLNNQRSNLRIATVSQNAMNKIKTRGTSKYLGVSLHRPNNKWVARYCLNKKQITIGFYDLQIEAAKARDEIVKEVYGEFARLNFQ